MHFVENVCFWIIAVLLTSSITANAQKDCIVGDMSYYDGQPISYFGLECLDQFSFDAMTSTCVDGTIVDTMSVDKCNDYTPYCTQCGVRAQGAAQCLYSLDEPCKAADDTTPIVYLTGLSVGGPASIYNPPTPAPYLSVGGPASIYTPKECIVGDIIYFNGDSIGYSGLECLDQFSFDAMTSTCVDGTIVSTQAVIKCDNTVPYCVQCGVRAQGAALCLSSLDIPCSATDTNIFTGSVISSNVATTGAGGMMMGGMGGMGIKGMGGGIALDAAIGVNGEMSMGGTMTGGKNRMRNLQTVDEHPSKPLRGSSM